MSRRKVLTPATVAEAHKLVGKGASGREVAARLGVSEGSVRTALKRAAPKKPKAKAPRRRPTPELAAPPTLDEQLAWLGNTVRARREDADRARRQGDDVTARQATRDALQAQALLVRHTSKREEDDLVVIPREAIDQAAATARAKILERIRRAAKGAP